MVIALAHTTDRAAPPAGRPPVLATERLTRRFGGFVAVRDVTLSFRQGEVHGLIGPNGAGKSTVFGLLSGMLPASAGRVLYRGQDISRLSPAEISRRGLVRSFQISALFGEMTVRENIAIALMRRSGLARRFWRPIHAMTPFDDAADALADRVGLAGLQERPVHILSYGRKRALELAMVLAMDPEVMLLDEPLAGMGGEDIEQVSALIRSLAGDHTIILVEHNLSVVEAICDRISVLQRGEIIASGGYAEVAALPQVRAAYLGADDV